MISYHNEIFQTDIFIADSAILNRMVKTFFSKNSILTKLRDFPVQEIHGINIGGLREITWRFEILCNSELFGIFQITKV